nr:TOBE domain-containing protein [Tabrizicola rongguiensis]
MQDELKAIQRRVGTTFVHVTHDQEEAMAIADRIVVMNAGRIEDLGPPREVYLRPKSLFSAGFMGEINRIPVNGDSSPLGLVALGNDRERVLCIRPESIRPAELATVGALQLGRATITDAAFFGTHVRAHATPLAAPEMQIVFHLPQSVLPAPGEIVDLAAMTWVLLDP